MHIPILRPRESASDYYNRFLCRFCAYVYSVLMQGVVDFRGLFMDVNIGWLGKVHWPGFLLSGKGCCTVGFGGYYCGDCMVKDP